MIGTAGQDTARGATITDTGVSRFGLQRIPKRGVRPMTSSHYRSVTPFIQISIFIEPDRKYCVFWLTRLEYGNGWWTAFVSVYGHQDISVVFNIGVVLVLRILGYVSYIKWHVLVRGRSVLVSPTARSVPCRHSAREIHYSLIVDVPDVPEDVGRNQLIRGRCTRWFSFTIGIYLMVRRHYLAKSMSDRTIETGEIYSALSHVHRRRILGTLLDRDSGCQTEIQLEELIDTDDDHVQLRHNHLPALKEKGLIKVDGEQKTIRKGPTYAQAKPIIKTIGLDNESID